MRTIRKRTSFLFGLVIFIVIVIMIVKFEKTVPDDIDAMKNAFANTEYTIEDYGDNCFIVYDENHNKVGEIYYFNEDEDIQQAFDNMKEHDYRSTTQYMEKWIVLGDEKVNKIFLGKSVE